MTEFLDPAYAIGGNYGEPRQQPGDGCDRSRVPNASGTVVQILDHQPGRPGRFPSERSAKSRQIQGGAQYREAGEATGVERCRPRLAGESRCITKKETQGITIQRSERAIKDVGFRSGHLTLPTTPLHKLICIQRTTGCRLSISAQQL